MTNKARALHRNNHGAVRFRTTGRRISIPFMQGGKLAGAAGHGAQVVMREYNPIGHAIMMAMQAARRRARNKARRTGRSSRV
ncbi:MAG: hypothetical protein JSS75_07400 [Bacteroidetes bacterium]|nr:hypothetical protein [Bacteroidota bacterium]